MIFHYELELDLDGTVELSHREAPQTASTPCLGVSPTGMDLQLWQNTDPDFSEDCDPNIFHLQLNFDDAGEYPNAYHGIIKADLYRDQLKRLRDFADFLLTAENAR